MGAGVGVAKLTCGTKATNNAIINIKIAAYLFNQSPPLIIGERFIRILRDASPGTQ